MNRKSSVVAAIVCSYILLVACAPQDPASGLVVSNVTVVSPERAESRGSAYVRILDGRIAEISDRALRGEEEIDGTGRFLIPGLIDSHVHLAMPPGFPAPMTPEQAAENPEVVAGALAQEPRSYLYFGFTTLFDLIGTNERTAQWNALEVRPDAYFCGGAMATDGQFRRALAPTMSYSEELILDPSGYSPEAAVDSIAADGASCVKTMYDIVVTPTLDQARALVAAAHRHNLPVFLHANREDGQAFGVAAGVDVIVHGMWRDFDEEAALSDEARDILTAIVRDDIGYQPTTQVMVGLIDMLDDGYLATPQLEETYPRIFIDWLERDLAGRYVSQVREIGIFDDLLAFRRETVSRATEVTSILAESDARLLFGSDTPSDTIYTNPAGLNGRLEMDNWIAAGVSEQELFRALTIDNARVLGLDDQIGTVEAGKAANLLLLGGDPLESVDAYDTIEIVFLHGRPIRRETLSARNVPED